MTRNGDKERIALSRLADALSEDILNMSDEDILADFRETGQDPAQNATDMIALFEQIRQREGTVFPASAKADIGKLSEGTAYDARTSDDSLTDSVRLSRLAFIMRAYPFFSEMFSKDAEASTLMEALRAKKAHYLTRDELLKIVRITGAKASLSRATQNEEKVVQFTTEAALATSSEEDAIARLRDLDGVGVTTASTVLSWCKPSVWPIIDRNALNALAEFGLIAPRPEERHPDLSDWPKFVGLVRDLSDRLNWEPYKASRWLHAFGKCELKAAQLSGKYAGTEPSVDPSSENTDGTLPNRS